MRQEQFIRPEPVKLNLGPLGFHKYASYFLAILLASISLLTACTRPPEAQFTVSAATGKAPFTMRFTNISENADAFQWDFGDGMTSAEQEPSHTYIKAGVFVVKLTAIMEDEEVPETSTFTQSITVEPGPLAKVVVQTADVTLTPTDTQSFAAKALDQFDNEIEGLTFNWSVGDGGTIDITGVFTAGTKAGTYDGAVSVVVTQDAVTKTATAAVIVQPGPLQDVKVEPAMAVVEVNNEQQFVPTALDQFNNSIPGLTYSFRSDQQAGQVDREGRFTAGTKVGTYEGAVTVEVRQSTVTTSATARITVEPGPIHHVLLMPGAPTVGVTQEQVFTAKALDQYDNEIYGLDFAWSASDESGTIDQAGVFTAGARAGTYEAAVTVSASQNSRAREVSIPATIEPGPLSSVLVEPSEISLDIGAAHPLTFRTFDEFGNEIPGAIASWSITPSVGTIDADGVLTAGTTAGTYEDVVSVEITQGIFTKIASADVTINPGPLHEVLITPSRVKAVPGQQQQFQANALDDFGNEIRGLRFSWDTGGAGTIDARGLFTAGPVPGRYLKDINATAVENGKEVLGAASVDIVFSGIGTATIDGRISPEEWDNATRLDFTANVPQGGTSPATLFVMNDNTNLYLAVRVARTLLDRTDLGFAFDQDLDGQRDAGFLLNNPNDFYDHFDGLLDADLGGTNDGLGMVTNDGTYTMYELSYPLDSADDENDFSLVAGDSIRFKIGLLRMIGPSGEFPQDYGDTRFPSLGFMEIVIAR